ncbi:MAG: biotin/lipoyl-binding protein [Burkholderiaceae bacterium]|nr:biotin/lipoyl-binding protein [Burkholderiaceae bacterium]
MTTNTQLIKDLIDLVAEERIAELYISSPQHNIRLLRRADSGADLHSSTRSNVDVVDSTEKAALTVPRTAHTVFAPMAGTFYRSSSVDGEPIVHTGSRVVIGTPLCVIEAMKMLNEVAADQAGTVAQVLCENGQTVDHGQALFIIHADEDASHVS